VQQAFRPLSGPESVIYAIWVIWVVSWLAAAAWSATTRARVAPGREIGYRLLTALGVVMLFIATPRAVGPPLISTSGALGWVLVGATLCGFLFAWWARIHLGALWSGRITRKEGHRVVDTGPYGLVRHPIYTGIILACYATAVAKGTVLALAGATIMTLGWYMKARVEERFLRAELGADAYDAYARRVPMLMPLIGV
jgi:protein-S-isoprenylcysteine O-methyltransferase Ste14